MGFCSLSVYFILFCRGPGLYSFRVFVGFFCFGSLFFLHNPETLHSSNPFLKWGLVVSFCFIFAFREGIEKRAQNLFINSENYFADHFGKVCVKWSPSHFQMPYPSSLPVVHSSQDGSISKRHIPSLPYFLFPTSILTKRL